MTQTTEPDRQAVEVEDVILWRIEQLERAGWSPLAALRLADMVDVDLHLACDLLEQGCSPALALRILV